jgi:hypothetical protein
MPESETECPWHALGEFQTDLCNGSTASTIFQRSHIYTGVGFDQFPKCNQHLFRSIVFYRSDVGNSALHRAR